MIQLTGALKRFGPKILFDELDWLITTGERTGLVGANGTGKTTLLKILAGLDGVDGGTITVMKGVTVGYLPQDGLSLSGRSVFAVDSANTTSPSNGANAGRTARAIPLIAIFATR